jgi:hypothetical protein
LVIIESSIEFVSSIISNVICCGIIGDNEVRGTRYVNVHAGANEVLEMFINNILFALSILNFVHHSHNSRRAQEARVVLVNLQVSIVSGFEISRNSSPVLSTL